METFALAHATLRISSLEEARRFYLDTLGFHGEEHGDVLQLSVIPKGPVLITLIEDRDASPRAKHSAGLFHLAILLRLGPRWPTYS